MDLGFSVAGLHDAAAGHDELGSGVETLVAALPALTAAPGSLGTMDAAAAFVAALARISDGLGRAAAREVQVRGRQSQGTSTTARLGELLESDTAAMAAAATPLAGPASILEQP